LVYNTIRKKERKKETDSCLGVERIEGNGQKMVLV
jgi:hypothetical protein